MRIKSSWIWAPIFALLLAMGPATTAQAGSYFVNAFAGSPLADYLFGDVDNSTSAGAVSSTYYTDGVNVFSSYGSSSVDLATATLKSYASANFGYYPDALPGLTSSFQFGNSSFGDSLTFLGSFTGQQATFNISVDGTWSGSTTFNGSDFQFMVLPQGTINANAGNTLNIFNNPGGVAIVNQIYSLTPDSTNPLTFSVNVTLNGVDPTIEFAANLNIVTSSNLGDSFTADYSDTATISLDTPAGVHFVSGSGVFPNSVPEPGSLAMAVIGVGGVGLLACARRRNRVVRTLMMARSLFGI